MQMNMEISMNSQQVLHLKEFVSYLTQSMHSKLPGSLVIWLVLGYVTGLVIRILSLWTLLTAAYLRTGMTV